MPSFGSTRDLEGNVFDLDNIAQEAITTSNAYTSSLVASRVPQIEYKIWFNQTLASSGVGNNQTLARYISVPSPASDWTMGPIFIYGIQEWSVDGLLSDLANLTIGKSGSLQRFLATTDIRTLGTGAFESYKPVNTAIDNQTIELRLATKVGKSGTDPGGSALVVVTLFAA